MPAVVRDDEPPTGPEDTHRLPHYRLGVIAGQVPEMVDRDDRVVRLVGQRHAGGVAVEERCRELRLEASRRSAWRSRGRRGS